MDTTASRGHEAKLEGRCTLQGPAKPEFANVPWAKSSLKGWRNRVPVWETTRTQGWEEFLWPLSSSTLSRNDSRRLKQKGIGGGGMTVKRIWGKAWRTGNEIRNQVTWNGYRKDGIALP